MAITHTLTISYRVASYNAEIDFGSDTFKMALYTSAAVLDQNTSAYTTEGEVVGTGYTAGGVTLTGIVVASDSGGAYIDFVDPEWANATFTTRGAMIYRSGLGNPSVAIIDFGSDKTVSSGLFRTSLPIASSSSAIIRYT